MSRRYALRHPVGNLVLADLQPDQVMAVKVRQSGQNATADSVIFIYTGGLYPRGTANLTKMLDERAGAADVAAAAANDDDDTDTDATTAATDTEADTDTAATSMQIDAKLAHHDSYGKAKNVGYIACAVIIRADHKRRVGRSEGGNCHSLQKKI